MSRARGKQVVTPPIVVPSSRVNAWGDAILSDEHVYETLVQELGDPFDEREVQDGPEGHESDGGTPAGA